MKKKMTAAFLFFGITTTVHAQSNGDGSSQHAMLVPDSATVYYDNGHKAIGGMAFSDSIGKGHYSFLPVVSNGRLVSMQLVKVNGAMQPGAPLPGFRFSTLDGKTYASSQLKGKTVVLNFWFTACAPCRAEIPELNALVKKYAQNPDVVFLAVTYDDADRVRKFLSSTAFNYAIAAEQGKLIAEYGIGGFPTNVVVGKDGRVAFELTSYGPENVKKLDEAIRAVSGM